MAEEPQSVWLELRGLRDILIQVRTTLDTVVKANDDHESRIRKLEERRFPLQLVAVWVSVIALIATVAGLVTTHF